MVSKPANLLNLVSSRALQHHAPSLQELDTHLAQARDAIHDAGLKETSTSGKFKNLYDAAHQLALAAFKTLGYRSGESQGHRSILFSSLEHAVPGTANDRPIFEKAHRDRNNAEYNGLPVLYSESELEALNDAVSNLQEEVDLMFRQWKKARPSGRK